MPKISEWQEWKHVYEEEDAYTDRMRVFGGYLYRTRLFDTSVSAKQVAIALCFVPVDRWKTDDP